MPIGNNNVGTYKAVSATGNIKNSSGALLGFFVSSSTALTVTLYDDAATGTTTPILATFTPATIGWFDLPASFVSGLYAVLGGTGTVTFVYV